MVCLSFLVLVAVVAARSGLSKIWHLSQKLTTAELSTHENPVLFLLKRHKTIWQPWLSSSCLLTCAFSQLNTGSFQPACWYPNPFLLCFFSWNQYENLMDVFTFVLCVCTSVFQLYNAIRENAPSFDDRQSWGGETDDGIVHNKVP